MSPRDPKHTKSNLSGRTRYESVVCFPIKESVLKLQTFQIQEDLYPQPLLMSRKRNNAGTDLEENQQGVTQGYNMMEACTIEISIEE